MRPVARALEGLWRLVGASSPPPVTHFAASMMSRSITVDASKAARELGYAPVISVEEGLASLGNLA